MNPRYPVYVISKGRWESRLTSRALELRSIPYRIVIEPQEYKQYAEVIDPKKILILPFSNLGQGSIPARNWVWEHSISEGHERHWILDDNIRKFFRYHKNMKWKTTDGTSFRVIEDLTDRYKNVGLSGKQYAMFIPRKRKRPPLILNTRIYSCILIKNDLPFRWRGRYNEDTDLSLRVLKAGMCTILCQAFLAEKMPTMTMKGGNTEELYRQNEQMDGRLRMAEALRAFHPDCVRVVWKWNRWQHSVDYGPWRKNRLVLKDGIAIPAEPQDYGLTLRYKQKAIADDC